MHGPLITDLLSVELQAEDREIIQHPAIAGIILFARNIESFQQVKSLCQQVRSVRPDIIIGVDQEGGRVQRLKDGVTQLPPLAAVGGLYAKDPASGLSLAQSLGWLMATEVHLAGIDMSFAPVLDMDTNQCPAIGDRSFGPEPEAVSELAKAYVRGMVSAGMPAVGKHFPGHGAVSADSHFSVPHDLRSLAEIKRQDLIPFKELIAVGLQAVMPAHIVFEAIDADNAVGFSKVWLQSILRRDFNFGGLIFSDDLNMAGAGQGGDYCQRARAALDAGCDLLLLCNNRRASLEVMDFLQDAPVSARVYQQWRQFFQQNRVSESREVHRKVAMVREHLSAALD